MEIAKDNIFNVRYNTKLDRLEFPKQNWTNRLYKSMKEHKFITATVITFFSFSTLNCILIYNFMQILKTI